MGTDIELAVLFSDVVGSTRIYEALGDQGAREVIALCIDLMQAATEQNHGTVIKTMGDEVMATFPTADDALNAAAQIQRSITTHPAPAGRGQPVSVRIGCHFGPVVLESRDVFGATVHTANRMTSQAKSGQIMTTAATVEQLSPEWRAAGAADRHRHAAGAGQRDHALRGDLADRGRHQHAAFAHDGHAAGAQGAAPAAGAGGPRGGGRRAPPADRHRPRRRERRDHPRQPDLAHPRPHRAQRAASSC